MGSEALVAGQAFEATLAASPVLELAFSSEQDQEPLQDSSIPDQKVSVRVEHQPVGGDAPFECARAATVFFETDSNELDGNNIAVLLEFAEQIEVSLVAEGWSDPRGTEA